MSMIKNYLEANFPIVFIRTIEGDYAEQEVRKAAQEYADIYPELHKVCDFGIWKATSGLLVNDIADYNEPQNKARDFIQALDYIERQAEANVSIITVFHNVRQFIHTYANIQKILDVVKIIQRTDSRIIFIGPELTPPPELQHLITFFDMPLPSKEELIKLFAKMVEVNQKALNLPKNKQEIRDLIRQAANAASGLDRIRAQNSIALSFITKKTIDLPTIQAQKAEEIRKSDVLEFFSTSETLDNVGGFDAYKKWLKRRARAFTQEARNFNLPYPKGVLICGIAGTGKSLVGKATSNYLGLPLIRLDMGKVFRSLVGDSEAAIRMALKTVEAVAPVILWIDEIEKGLAGMENSGLNDSGVTSRVVSTLLTWKQETLAPVFLVATANNVINLPSMVYRAGRLDAVWSTDLPLDYEREAIFSIHIRKVGRDPKNFDLPMLAELTHGFTGAEIEGVISDALYSAFDDNSELTMQYLIASIKDTVPQSVRNSEEIEVIREWVKTRARPVSTGIDKKHKATIKKLRLTTNN